jgi:hypothetical protein
MEIAIFLLIALIVLDLAAWRWGIDSRDCRSYRDWEKRR